MFLTRFWRVTKGTSEAHLTIKIAFGTPSLSPSFARRSRLVPCAVMRVFTPGVTAPRAQGAEPSGRAASTSVLLFDPTVAARLCGPLCLYWCETAPVIPSPLVPKI